MHLDNWLGRSIIERDLNSKKAYGVLVVDDSDDDRFFLRYATEQFPRFRLLQELLNAEAAVDYLTGQGRYQQRDQYPLPDLVLLDLKMPGMGGFGFLRWLRTQSFPALTVVVLSTSVLHEDMLLSRALGAHGYWSKPASREKQRLMVFEIEALVDARAPLFP